MNTEIKIARTVLNELDSFDKSFRVGEYRDPESTPEAGPSTRAVYESQKHLLNEPFISYVKVRESDNGADWVERIYLICRNYQPIGIDPVTENASFANRNAKIGTIASADIGDEISVRLPRTTKTRTCIVLEKDIFTPVKTQEWDAQNNYISYGLEDEFVRSARALFPHLKQPGIEEPQPEVPVPGKQLLKELERAEIASREQQGAATRYLQNRTREIVRSIALKDQPILDKSQNEICRMPLDSQILLTGSPGTGKTTTLIKRIAFKSDSEHLRENDEIELQPDQLENWIMFTPNDLLKIYLKEAMNKEGLLATDHKVATWERYRTTLGRQVLKFLKHDKKGVFTRTNDDLLVDNSSASVMIFALQFVTYFNQSIQAGFGDSISLMEGHRPPADIISKENGPLSHGLVQFTRECRALMNRVSKGTFENSDIATLEFIDGFSNLQENWLRLRDELATLVNSVIDAVIMARPEIIDDVAKILADEPVQKEIEPDQADFNEEEIEEEEIVDNAFEDLRLRARKLLRQAVVRHSESLATKTSIKNKRFRRIQELAEPHLHDLGLLTFIGHVNTSLKSPIFGRLNYSRFLQQIPILYDRYRRSLLKDAGPDLKFRPEVAEKLKDKRISSAEIDVLIFVMLRFAARIFQRNRDFLEDETNFDLLENIKSVYHTQVAVDEAADFSAVQLGCMFNLAHPKFSSVSFAGDLMQRVTTYGITDWRECNFISENLQKLELQISYRQTPVLLKMAERLYENSIGEAAPFHSKNTDTANDPRPLKFETDNDHELGEWIGERIHEIYVLNDEKLPSIAIFVPDEDDISRTYEIVHEKLNELSIDVERCPEGKVLGTGECVRIFSVEYIKGLEFEAVFFVGIDEIHRRKADLLDKYLYVGLTRATTFLGVTYRDEFPERLAFVAENFETGNWANFIE